MKDFKLKPYICTQCGGRVNRNTLVCEWCGTMFRETQDDAGVKIQIERRGVHTIGQTKLIDREMYHRIPPKELAAIVNEQLERELAQVIAPFVDMQVEEDSFSNSIKITSRIRVCDKDYRF